MYEPYLLQLGFLMKTPRGRMLTDAAWSHLGLTPPEGFGESQQYSFADEEEAQ